MNKKEEVQEWFLIKYNWESWITTLSDEDAGKLLKALYTGNMPDGLLGTLITSHIEEFHRVNDFRVEKQEQRSEVGRKSVQARWDNRRALEEERKLKYTDVYKRMDNDTNVTERNTNTEYISHNTKNIVHNTKNMVHNIKDNSIVVEWDNIINE